MSGSLASSIEPITSKDFVPLCNCCWIVEVEDRGTSRVRFNNFTGVMPMRSLGRAHLLWDCPDRLIMFCFGHQWYGGFYYENFAVV